MPHDAILTVRLPESLKRELERRASGNRRSLSAQVLFELEAGGAAPPEESRAGKFLGSFAGAAVPTDEQFAAVRHRLWAQLRTRARRDRRRS